MRVSLETLIEWEDYVMGRVERMPDSLQLAAFGMIKDKTTEKQNDKN